MKAKYIITLAFCVLWGWKVLAQTSTQNYIRTEVLRVKDKKTDGDVDTTGHTGKTTQIIYYDGLGRPEQTNLYKASPNGYDLVSPIGYDDFGRQDKTYLPFTAPQNGAYHTSAASAANFSQYGTTDQGYAFSETVYEASPLNRTLKQASPGLNWSKGSGHELKYEYGTNLGDQVYNFTVTNVSGGTPADFYPPNSLYKTTSWDENNSQSQSTSRTEEYKDKLGQVVLKRTYDGTLPHSTYYVYNDLGLLCYVIPPKAADDGNITPTELDQLCYQYVYDERKRLIEKKLPGAGWEYLIYDIRDRLVLTQDAKLRASGPDPNVDSKKYHYTKYEALNRPVEQGICTESYAYADLRNTVKGSTDYAPNDCNPDTYTYYDNYNWAPPHGYSQVYTDHAQTNNVKGLVTGVKTKVLGTSTWLYTVNYYDKYGQLIQSFQQNPEGGHNRISTAYNFAGQAIKQQTEHKKTASSTPVTINEQFDYDHMGRPTYVYHGYDTTTLTQLAKFNYDELGRMQLKELHNGLQDIDHSYNIRGWLTRLNDPNVSADNNKLFAMQLFYDTDMSSALNGNAQFNGNINGIMWQGPSSSKKGYNYTYDGLNRLTQADYGTYNGSWTNTTAYDMNIASYDANGNINGLNRKDSNGSNRENLTYTYSGENIGNQLASVSGTYNGATASGNFGYDANGNATSDGLRAISTIAYFDELNLPEQYYKDAANKVEYSYDARGNKWGKTATIGGTIAPTLYYGPFVYINGTPSKVLTSEGYYDVQSRLYHYYLKDHLGNTRITFHYSGTTPEVVQEAEYYPFGSTFAYNNLDKNTYLYNGKELNNEFFENYDYGARFYDPSLGRWHSVDPLADQAPSWSPYRYGFNNPISFTDPTGMLETKYEDEEHRLLLETKDGSDAVVTVTNDKRAGFDAAVKGTTNTDDPSWNNSMKKYALGFELSGAQENALSSLNSDWSRRNAITFWQNPTAGNAAAFAFSEALSQWTNPELVVTGLSAGVVGLSAIPKSTNGVLNPNEIHFMQSSIKNTTGEFTVLGNAEALANGNLSPNVLRMNVWKDAGGKVWTLDHRRLAAFRLSGLQEAPIQWANPTGQMWKMTTTNGGTSIKLKLGGGQSMIIK